MFQTLGFLEVYIDVRDESECSFGERLQEISILCSKLSLVRSNVPGSLRRSAEI